MPQPPLTWPTTASAVEAHVVEEDLVELGLAGDLAQAADVTPSASIGTMNIVRPLCLGASGSVRASSRP